MKNIGKVIEIFSADKNSSGLPRPRVNNLNIIEGYGIENDKFAGKDENKSLMIVGLTAYTIAKENSIDLEFGSLGENILFDFNPHEFKVGTVFYIDEVKLEITQNCTICNHLSIFGKELPSLVRHHRGLYCKILSSGIITKENIVYIKEET